MKLRLIQGGAGQPPEFDRRELSLEEKLELSIKALIANPMRRGVVPPDHLPSDETLESIHESILRCIRSIEEE